MIFVLLPVIIVVISRLSVSRLYVMMLGIIEQLLLLCHKMLDVRKGIIQLTLATKHLVVVPHSWDAMRVLVTLGSADTFEKLFRDIGDSFPTLLKLHIVSLK